MSLRHMGLAPSVRGLSPALQSRRTHAVLLPESFRGGCSFGAGLNRPLPRMFSTNGAKVVGASQKGKGPRRRAAAAAAHDSSRTSPVLTAAQQNTSESRLGHALALTTYDVDKHRNLSRLLAQILHSLIVPSLRKPASTFPDHAPRKKQAAGPTVRRPGRKRFYFWVERPYFFMSSFTRSCGRAKVVLSSRPFIVSAATIALMMASSVA